MDVIVTAPHSRCTAAAHEHWCDSRALAIASALADFLQRTLPAAYRISLYTSHHRRELLDDNRPASRGSEWRVKIQQRVDFALAAGRRALVLDVHSYPDEQASFGVDAGGHVPPLVRLALQAPHVSLLQSRLPFLTVLAASRDNDIVARAADAGAVGLLLEFNESKHALSPALVEKTFAALAAYAEYLLTH